MAYSAGECHLAENTVAAYRRDLTHFFEWLQHRSIPELSIRDLARLCWLAPRPQPGPPPASPGTSSLSRSFSATCNSKA